MIQIGVDFGGTKIEAAALDVNGRFLARVRSPNPGDYESAIREVCELVARVERDAAGQGTIGIGTPGSVSPRIGLMRNSNSVYLNGRPFAEDLQAALGREVRLANDANCMALSEAVDGAAAGARSAFGVIIGTGVGGGLVIDGRIVEGASGVGGEWGHVPLPWMTPPEFPGPPCWCGKSGCLELFVSGTGFARTHRERSGKMLEGSAVIDAARQGDREALASFDTYVDQLGRALAMVVNIVDPEVFVLGGGMSNVVELYERLPDAIRSFAFCDSWEGRVVAAEWGDSSGVRGAARLWPP